MNGLLKIVLLSLALSAPTIAHARYWMDMMECNDGQVKLQVDLGERRDVRLTLSDWRIKKYFIHQLSTILDDGYWPGVGPYFPSRGSVDETRFELPMVVEGRSSSGIFNSDHFSSFRQGPEIFNRETIDCQPYSGGCGSSGPSFLAERIGGGLKVAFWRPRHYSRRCVETDSYSGQCLQWQQVTSWNPRELVNWWFDRCETKPVLP